MKALNTLQINHILKNNNVTKGMFIGTYPACIIPKTNKLKYTFVSNTHVHEKSGEHWNAWMVEGDTVSFFDSFGRSVFDPSLPSYYRDFVKKFKIVKCNLVQVQHFNSIACGFFCVHYIYLASLGVNFKHFLSDYSRDLKSNDDIVFDIIKSISKSFSIITD